MTGHGKHDTFCNSRQLQWKNPTGKVKEGKQNDHSDHRTLIIYIYKFDQPGLKEKKIF